MSKKRTKKAHNKTYKSLYNKLLNKFVVFKKTEYEEYKILLLLVVLIIPHLILSQNSSKVEFEGGEIYLIAETDKQIFKKPIQSN